MITVCCCVSTAVCTSLFMAFFSFYICKGILEQLACTMISYAAVLAALLHVLQLSFVLEALCLKLSATLNVHHVFESFLPEWTYTLSLCSLCLELSFSPRCRLLSRWMPLKQLPRSLTVLCVYPTTPAVISQIIGATVGTSRVEKRMCQMGHQFLAERSVPLHRRSKLLHFPGCEEVNVPPDQAFII